MKKAIKVALIILIIASMLFVLTGCGKEDKKENSKTDNAKNEQVVEDESKESSKEISMGEWEDDTYENEFLGLKFNLPKGWTYSTQEEIAEMMSIGKELLNDDQKAAAELAKLTSVYYINASNPATGDSVTILTEKPLAKITAEEYIAQLKLQLQALESMDYKIEGDSEETVSGKKYETLSVTASVSGVEVSQKYYLREIDKYIVCIIVTSTSGQDNIDTIMESFK